jgi:hypothetical protein
MLYFSPWLRPVLTFLATFGSQAPSAEESSERTLKKRTEFQQTAGPAGGFFLT